MTHTFLTVAIPFSPEKLNGVDEVIHEQGKAAKKGGSIRDSLRDKGVHFLSITTVPGNQGHQAFVIIESVHDDNKQDALQLIVSKLAGPLSAIFAAADITVPNDSLYELLNGNSLETEQSRFAIPGLNHDGTPGMTVERIKREAKFAKAIRRILIDHPKIDTPLNKLRMVREEIFSQDEFTDMRKADDITLLAPEPRASNKISLTTALAWRGLLTFYWPWLIFGAVVTLIVGIITFYQMKPTSTGGIVLGMMLLSLIFFALTLMGWVILEYFSLRFQEDHDKPDDTAPDFNTLSKIMDLEDDGDNNHLAAISVMKPGRVRKLALRLAFWVIAQIARRQYRPGFLADLGTIHFARWVLLPGTNKLLFFSNYGGSWESYLEDFITKASNGLTGVWSNTLGFPRTSNLFLEGAKDGDRFKRWARRQQRPTLFWYRAYPNKTTRLIRLNAAIRHGVLAAQTEDEAVDWLALFGSRRRKPGTIESHEVQSVLFGGMKGLKIATCHLWQLPNEVEKAKEWLKKIKDNISFGDRPPTESAQIIAFTQRGLQQLGLDRSQLNEFPIAFQQGMSYPKRATRVLADIDDDHPKNWNWGNENNSVDAALIVYAKSNENGNALQNACKNSLNLLAKFGGEEIAKIETLPLPEEGHSVEAFGFVDGVSQPVIKGTQRWHLHMDSRNVVEPGEFILGYPDNRGYLPTTPTVPAKSDQNNILTAYRERAVEHDWPLFRETSANGRHDIGRNGSYLVIRQLEQNVDLFKRTIASIASRIKDHPGLPPGLSHEQLETWVSAKMVGRWPDGTSLVRYPFAPGTGWDGKKTDVKPDNKYLLGEEDPEGYRCPFSAHIRRANPQDSFHPGSENQLAIINRHRILRIGRQYGPVDTNSTEPRGLLFMCLNADLERQFEFIQQTWVMSRLFHGLSGEVDAILGRGHMGGQLTIPTPQGPIVLQGIKDFVSVRGGAYFFLPSRSTIHYLCG